jgi:hypothetical protein
MNPGYISLQKLYVAEIEAELKKFPVYKPQVITENDMAFLPEPVQKYLRYCGYVGKMHVSNARVEWKDVYLKRDIGTSWMKMDCYQFNSVAEPTRIVYMKAKLLGLFPFEGRDKCQDGHGNMLIRFLRLLTVADVKGKEMDASALVTVLAEALFIPGYVFQNYISWSGIDSNTVKATLQFKGTIVTGLFYFNERGEFTRFETYDRYYSAKEAASKKIKWTATVSDYTEENGIRFPSVFKATWNREEGDFDYFKGKVASVQFNIEDGSKILLPVKRILEEDLSNVS